MRPTHVLTAFLAIATATPLLAQNDKTALETTVAAVRTAGTTLTAWELERPGGDKAFLDRVATTTSFDWKACPSITLAAARTLLGAEQGAKLPDRDGWGHALEYCLRTGSTGSAAHAVGVRSPGRDGRFDATVYVPSAFDPSQQDHDVVWIDGVFVTAPLPNRP